MFDIQEELKKTSRVSRGFILCMGRRTRSSMLEKPSV